MKKRIFRGAVPILTAAFLLVWTLPGAQAAQAALGAVRQTSGGQIAVSPGGTVNILSGTQLMLEWGTPVSYDASTKITGVSYQVIMSWSGEAVFAGMECTGGDLEVFGKAGSVIRVESADSAAVTVTGGSAHIQDVTFTASGRDAGISVGKSLLVSEGAQVTGTAQGGTGVQAKEGVSVGQKSSLSGTGGRGYGVRADGGIQLSGGSLQGTGSSGGVSAGASGIILAGGTVTETVQGVTEIGGDRPQALNLPVGIHSYSSYIWSIPSGNGEVEVTDEGVVAVKSSNGNTVLVGERTAHHTGEPVNLAQGGRHVVQIPVRLQAAREETNPGDGDEQDGENGGDGETPGGGGNETGGEKPDPGEEPEENGGDNSGEDGNGGDTNGSGGGEEGEEPSGGDGGSGIQIPPPVFGGEEEDGEGGGGEEAGPEDPGDTVKLAGGAAAAGASSYSGGRRETGGGERIDTDPPASGQEKQGEGDQPAEDSIQRLNLNGLPGVAVSSIDSGFVPGELPATGQASRGGEKPPQKPEALCGGVEGRHPRRRAIAI